MLCVLFWLLVMIPVALTVHEFSHWFVARRLGVPMSWRFSWGELRISRVPWFCLRVPRWLWTIPISRSDPRARPVAAAGFRGEFLGVVPVLLAGMLVSGWAPGLCYALVAIAHRLLYPLYAGDDSDLTAPEVTD